MGFAPSRVVLISRCAWHRRYHGYTKVLGISSWQGLNVSFTDGICSKCAARVRADHLRARFDRGASADRRGTAWLPGLAAASLATMVALVLIARPTHELPPVPAAVAVLPPAADESASIGEAPSAPPVATPLVAHPQRSRPVATRPLVVAETASVTWSRSETIAHVAVPRSTRYVVRRVSVPRDTAQSP
jgi:hypothetical protein